MIRHVVRTLVYGAIFSFVAGIGLFIWVLENREDLRPWHTEELDAEFRAELFETGKIRTLADYRTLEETLFAQLQERVYDAADNTVHRETKRYTRGSLTDPESMTPNWNRSFERPHPEPRAAVLLLHGLSDSPYSTRALAEFLAARGAWVLALRVPGHGTAPVGLSDIHWQDFAAATQLAVAHLAQSVGAETPLYLVGYSNGAALAVHYALAARADPALRTPQGLILLAPAIGITRAAALAVWQARIGSVLGLDKLAWNSILPEYDPYKYNSFAVNAGEQMFQLTRAIAAGMDAVAEPQGIRRFPRTLVFHSLVDATVISRAVVDRLLGRLAPEGHELVLFDLNRVAGLQPFVRGDPGQLRDALAGDDSLPFTFTLVTNEDETTRDMVARRKTPGDPFQERALGLAWPEGVYSLSHLAIPFRPEDPWYGFAAPPDTPVALGRLAPRGERGVLIVSAADALRLRSNPFFPYLEQRVVEFMQLGD